MMQSRDSRVTVLGVMRLLGGLAVLAVGAIHLQQYLGADYRSIPTIGPLFLLNAIGSGLVGTVLVVPFERGLMPRRANLAIALVALLAVTIAAGSLIALVISETASLFGFSETGYRAPIVIAIVAEAATILLLLPVVVDRLRARFIRGAGTRDPRWTDMSSRGLRAR